MKLKRPLLCLLTAACLFLAAAAPALAEGTSDDQGLVTVGFMDDVVVYPTDDAWNLFSECFNMVYPKTTLLTVKEMEQQHGAVAASQYVNCINHFYDVGDPFVFQYARWQIDDPSGDYAKGTTPMADTRFASPYVPGSASPASATPVTEAPFPDVPPEAWYAKAVSEMKDSGIIEGCDDGLFHPERPVTIGEFYAMLVRAITSTRIDATVATGVSNDTHWTNGVMENARRAYLWPPENEHVDDYVLRGEATCRTVLAHYYAERNGQYEAGWTWSLARERTVGNTTLADIPDSATIEQYLKNPPVPLHDLNTEKILYAYNYGITKGVDAAGTFNPYGTLTRAEAAQFLYNARLTERTGAIKDGLLQ